MRKWLPNRRRCSLLATSKTGSGCETKGRNDGAKRRRPVLGTVFANLWAGKQRVQPTAWANTPEGSRPITARDGLLQGSCEARVAFALALRVAMTEFDEEMRKQGVGWTSDLENWAYVDNITLAMTAELAPLVMTKLRQTLERRGLGLRKDKCTAYCPKPERVEDIRDEMAQFLKWTPDGLMIVGTASDGEYRTDITTEARKSREPTSSRLRNGRLLADRIEQMCEADPECRRLAPAWGDHCF